MRPTTVLPTTLRSTERLNPSVVVAGIVCGTAGFLIGGVPLAVAEMTVALTAIVTGPLVAYLAAHVVALVFVGSLTPGDVLVLEVGAVFILAVPLDTELPWRTQAGFLGVVAGSVVVTTVTWLVTQSLLQTATILAVGLVLAGYLSHRYELVTLGLVEEATAGQNT